MNDQTSKKEKAKDVRTYLIGLAWALGLSAVAFGAVHFHLSAKAAFLIVGLCAIAQLCLQLRYFFHIDHSKQSQEDLQLILFSFLMIVIMVAGTIWVFTNLSHRMMMPM